MKNLYAALLAAQKAIRGVEKDSQNEGGRSSSGKERASFAYVSIERMVGDARAVLHDNGLVLTTDGASIEGEVLVQKWTLAHPASGETMPVTSAMPIVVTAGRAADWATGAASSYALKGLLRDLLQIPRGEDAEGRDYSDFDPNAIGEDTYQREIVPLGKASGMTLAKIEDAVWAKHPELQDKHPSLWPKAMLPDLLAWLRELCKPTEPPQPTQPPFVPDQTKPATSRSAALRAKVAAKKTEPDSVAGIPI